MRRTLLAFFGLFLVGIAAACINLPFDVKAGCFGPVSWQDSVWVFPDTVVVANDSGTVKVCWKDAR